MTVCGVRVLLNAYYKDIKYEYGIPRLAMASHLRKICHPLQCRNMRQLHQRTKTGEVSIPNIREVLHMSVKKNKVGRSTYLSPCEELFMITASDIEDSHGLPIDTYLISDEMQSGIE